MKKDIKECVVMLDMEKDMKEWQKKTQNAKGHGRRSKQYNNKNLPKELK